MTRLGRLLRPRGIAVIGGGAWCAAIDKAAAALGFNGALTPVHPTRALIGGRATVPSIEDVPHPIDAAFIGVNRHATLDILRDLRAVDAGGAICFASGFAEASAEDNEASDLQTALLEAAGDLPILGPNCYGFLNALDGAGIWPDQHGLTPVDSGVGILTQSSNIAINLTMQARGLPIAMVVTCGNQAQTSQAELAAHLVDDPRITALGLHIEGFGDLRAWESLAAKAHALGKPIVALKSGRSAQAQAAAISHTASLAGGDAGATAFLERLGIARVDGLPQLIETLKLLHCGGPLPHGGIASISCSGGEAALVADTAVGSMVSFPPLNDTQRVRLGEALGPMVALANPLDYHTYIWRDEAAMTRAWAAMADPDIALTLIVLDYPRADRCDPSDWDIATRAVIAAAQETGARYAVVSSLPELLPERTCDALMAAGVTPLNGLDHALTAVEAAVRRVQDPRPVVLPGLDRRAKDITEAAAKAALAEHGLAVPRAITAPDQMQAARLVADFVGPVALKVLGLAHKTGAGGIALNIRGEDDALSAPLTAGPILVEEMVCGAVAELLIGITRDPAHGFVLTLAAGGTMTELWADSAHLLVPASREACSDALTRLRMAPLLTGYRGAEPADHPAILDAIEALQSYVTANAATVEEVEVNPLLCTPTGAVAADALIRKAPDDTPA
ncbi:MAG: acetate--CoA ligase family protein [Shimia sp.]